MQLELWKWLGNNTAETIAICALAFTAYQAYLSRKHNRLSVLPKLTLNAERNSENNIGLFNLKISNNGLGPAIIKSYEIEFKNKVQEFGSSSEALEFIENLVGIINIKTSVAYYLPEHIISAGEAVDVMQISYMEDNGEGTKHIEDIIDKLSLRVIYSSVYGDKFEYHSIESHMKKLNI